MYDFLLSQTIWLLLHVIYIISEYTAKDYNLTAGPVKVTPTF